MVADQKRVPDTSATLQGVAASGELVNAAAETVPSFEWSPFEFLLEYECFFERANTSSLAIGSLQGVLQCCYKPKLYRKIRESDLMRVVYSSKRLWAM
ncbi:hypothetical protein C481_07746 [Natrialba asiatica DSM 12278]|uniref:Uncharacterized protein n=1 Tax=Natrialba asiatica (strain ATCC 700177 / DSM 12278 / JCM 9576 / FERM P-10747 / NBRC 102637 / 172P1) TaxID=29540 RepID=M0AX56_NATA1|nr:hypothetical protein C481_07746 [Natrialba asiatica DSM 12278]